MKLLSCGPVLLAFSTSSQTSTSFSWVQPAIGITQIVVGFVQAFILWQLTYRIFRRNSEQKISERQAAWFHKVVVDPQISELRNFFSTSRELLTSAANRCLAEKSMTGTSESWDSIITQAIGGFYSQLLPTRRALVDVVGGFDPHGADTLGKALLGLQEKISDFFEEFRKTQSDYFQEDLAARLAETHNFILNELRGIEFKHWGLPNSRSSADSMRQLWRKYTAAIEQMKAAE